MNVFQLIQVLTLKSQICSALCFFMCENTLKMQTIKQKLYID